MDVKSFGLFWVKDFYVEDSTVRYHEVWSRTRKASDTCIH